MVALAGIGIGALLVLSAFFQVTEGEQQSRAAQIADKALRARAPIGIIGMLVALLHFLFPGTLLI